MITKLRASNYDALRLSRGLTGDLTFYKTPSSTGRTLLTTISEGWFAERERDAALDQEVLIVRLEATDKNAAKLTATVTDYMTALGFMGRVFAIHQRTEPLGDPAEWTFRCDSTGEEL